MATGQLSLYQNALLLCGAESLKDLTENREPKRKLDLVWDSGRFVKGCLEQADWNFALRTQRLTYEPSIQPDFGYRYAFVKPADWVRTAMISGSEGFDPALTRYSDEAGYWYSPLDTIYVQFVSNDAEYGLDYSKWSESFTEWVEARLAKKVISRLTSSNTTFDKLDKLERRLYKTALKNDVRNQPAVFMPRGSWANSRAGGRVYDPKDRR